jgi:hypothetical protein
MRPYLNTVLVLLAAAWLPGMLLPAPAYPFEDSSADLQAEVQALHTKIAELQMTVSALVTQMSTLSTAVITLQTQSMTASSGPQNVLASAPTKPPDVSATPDRAVAQAMRVTPQKNMDERSFGSHIADYRFLGYLYQSGVQRAFIGRGRDIFIVSVGEIVDNTLEVLAIDASGIKVRDTHSDAEMTLSQNKAKPEPS